MTTMDNETRPTLFFPRAWERYFALALGHGHQWATALKYPTHGTARLGALRGAMESAENAAHAGDASQEAVMFPGIDGVTIQLLLEHIEQVRATPEGKARWSRANRCRNQFESEQKITGLRMLPWRYSGASVASVTEAALNARPNDTEQALTGTFPRELDGNLYHETGKSRLRWFVGVDGSTTIEVCRPGKRPDGVNEFERAPSLVVLRLHMMHNGRVSVTVVSQQRGPDHAAFVRHWEALRAAARMLGRECVEAVDAVCPRIVLTTIWFCEAARDGSKGRDAEAIEKAERQCAFEIKRADEMIAAASVPLLRTYAQRRAEGRV